jgi:hypothetical protein
MVLLARLVLPLLTMPVLGGVPALPLLLPLPLM